MAKAHITLAVMAALMPTQTTKEHFYRHFPQLVLANIIRVVTMDDHFLYPTAHHLEAFLHHQEVLNIRNFLNFTKILFVFIFAVIGGVAGDDWAGLLYVKQMSTANDSDPLDSISGLITTVAGFFIGVTLIGYIAARIILKKGKPIFKSF